MAIRRVTRLMFLAIFGTRMYSGNRDTWLLQVTRYGNGNIELSNQRV